MKKNSIKICAIIMAAYITAVFAFYFIAGETFRQGTVSTEFVNPKYVTGELLTGHTITQKFLVETDTIDSISVRGSTFARINNDVLDISLKKNSGETLAIVHLATAELQDNSVWTISFPEKIKVINGEGVTLSITSTNGASGNAVTFYYGDTVSAGKFEVSKKVNSVYYDGSALNGELCFSVMGTMYYALAQYYWYFAVAMGIFLLTYLLKVSWDIKRGKTNVVFGAFYSLKKYRFLLKQLVARDFKTKYKRSVLGMFWSFLNPLLTMLVLYTVFSTLFKSSINNFPAYLLTGIVCWNFFSESTNMCLSSITGNSSLIMKVYVPKFMYPFSRTVSSLVNLALSLIPLFFVLLITKAGFSLVILLLPFPLLCLFFVSIGIGLILASSMVFFRDTQFLWGVVSTLWMYLTPIFYDPNIIPANMMTLYKINPLYHIIRVFRIILIDGASPEPKAYLLCLLASAVPLVLGVWVFYKSQEKFVLYL